ITFFVARLIDRWNVQLMFLFLIFCHRTSTFIENASAYSPFRRFPVPSFPMFLPCVHSDVDRGRSAGLQHSADAHTDPMPLCSLERHAERFWESGAGAPAAPHFAAGTRRSPCGPNC